MGLIKRLNKRQAELALVSVTLALLVPALHAQSPETWRGLVVAPEHRCSPYRSDDYHYPQSVEPRIVDALGGRIYGPYTGRDFESIRQTDIEHIVARSEAHDSGLCAADATTRRRFAADLDNLTLASPSVNRHRKRAHDAAEWLPDRNQCWFAGRVVAVKQEYGLTVDRREAEALDRVLSDCTSTEMVMDGPAMVVPPKASLRPADRPRRPSDVRRQRQRPDHVQGSALARHRAGATQSPSVPLYAGWRRGRCGV